jgi:hypothetical protein
MKGSLSYKRNISQDKDEENTTQHRHFYPNTK